MYERTDCEFYSTGWNTLTKQPPYDGFSSGVMENHFSLQAFVPSCTIKEKEVQEDNQMSFVIMMANENGIAVASDSKSTLTDVTQQQYEEKERYTRKIFKTEDLVVATCDTNRVNIHQVSVELENVLPDFLCGVRTRDDFLRLLESRFGDMAVSETAVYSFMVGERYLDAYRISSVTYQKTGKIMIETNPIYTKFSARMMGNRTFAPKNINIREDWSLEQMKHIVQLTTEYVIKVGEAFTENGYYSVGGPVQVETFV